MGFVRCLVLAETCVAIYAVGAILYSKTSYVTIIFSYLTYQLFAEFVPFGLYFQIPVLICSKPLLIIIARKIAQEL